MQIGAEIADSRRDRTNRGTQLRGAGHGLQVLDDPHRAVQRLGQRIERPHGVLEVRRHRLSREIPDSPACILDQGLRYYFPHIADSAR